MSKNHLQPIVIISAKLDNSILKSCPSKFHNIFTTKKNPILVSLVTYDHKGVKRRTEVAHSKGAARTVYTAETRARGSENELG